MSDGQGDGGQGDGGAGGAAGGAGGGGEQQQQQQQAPEWLAGLSEDLRGDPTLSRYASLDDFARGHLETKRVASSKVIVPGDGADAAALQAFYDGIGRPKDPAGYEIPVPEGAPADLADVARGKFHELGLRPEQAKGIAEFWNGYQKAQLDKIVSTSEAELSAFKAATPDFDAQLAGVQALAKKLGVDEATANELDVKLGTPNLLKLFFGLNKIAGEAARIDGDAAFNGGVNTADAAKQLRELDASGEWRKKILDQDPEAMRKRSILIEAANRQRQAAQKPA